MTRFSLAPSANNPDLLVWPEAPAPFSYQDPQFAKFAGELASQFDHPFLAGVIEWKTDRRSRRGERHAALVPYNSAFFLTRKVNAFFPTTKFTSCPSANTNRFR